MSFDGLSNMHVLIVEDEADFILELQRILLAFPSPINIKVAKSRDSALALIDSEFFDLIILDLKIPTIDGALDAVPAYGNAVFSKARENAPGTPIFVLTGSSAEDFIPGLLAQQQRENIWGDGREFGTVDFLKKYSFDEFPKKLNPITSAIQSLSEVELDRETLNLSIQEDRLIRIFARRFCGVRCVISPLKTGLSGATVVRLKLTDSSGASVIYAVAKLGSLGEIEDESLRYRSHVVRLDPVATPRNLATLKFGAKASAGIFYGLAGGEDTAFDIVTRPEAFCTAAIRSLASGTGRWFDGVPETRLPIKDIRQRILSDSALDRILTEFNIPWVYDFETRQIQTRWCCIHGDLHGCNVLVTANGSSILIDYGDVGNGPASLDPVTLELSLFFHPQGPFHDRGPLAACGWPSERDIMHWGNPDRYLEGCPAPHFIRGCREWARTVAVGNRDLAASAYSYLIRQLKYRDTNKNLALALLDSVKMVFDNT